MTTGTMRRSVAPDLEMIQQLAHSAFGLDLRNGKEELIIARIGKVMRKQKLGSFKDYYDYVVADRSGVALAEMIDALTTNYTSFFRESTHFELLKKTILPAAKRDKLRIWSAACATGEEPYSIAFCLYDAGFTTASAEVIATDISQKVLGEANAAMYKEDTLKSMGLEERRRYFLAGIGMKSGWFKVKPEIRRMVHFASHNLIGPPGNKGKFDVIFCRNVMIYFNNATQQQVICGLQQALRPGGYLLIGHSETLNGVQHSLQYVSPAVYRSVTS
jgi:chemotaxis protein methyltransferase CheR